MIIWIAARSYVANVKRTVIQFFYVILVNDQNGGLKLHIRLLMMTMLIKLPKLENVHLKKSYEKSAWYKINLHFTQNLTTYHIDPLYMNFNVLYYWYFICDPVIDIMYYTVSIWNALVVT